MTCQKVEPRQNLSGFEEQVHFLLHFIINNNNNNNTFYLWGSFYTLKVTLQDKKIVIIIVKTNRTLLITDEWWSCWICQCEKMCFQAGFEFKIFTFFDDAVNLWVALKLKEKSDKTLPTFESCAGDYERVLHWLFQPPLCHSLK